MFALREKNVKKLFSENYCRLKFNTVFSKFTLKKNDRISRNDDLFSSLNNFRKLHCLNFINYFKLIS